MLNIQFLYEDSITALKEYSDSLQINSLPSTVCLLQQDFLNQYSHAITHYLPLELTEDFLQNSSIGTPYEKWAKFTNEDFENMWFCLRNLICYTSRLIHETICKDLKDKKKYSEMKGVSNCYRSITYKKYLGIEVNRKRKILYLSRVTEEPFNRVEIKKYKISDRSIIYKIQNDAEQELQQLKILHSEFQNICKNFYSKKAPIQKSIKMNSDGWIPFRSPVYFKYTHSLFIVCLQFFIIYSCVYFFKWPLEVSFLLAFIVWVVHVCFSYLSDLMDR